MRQDTFALRYPELEALLAEVHRVASVGRPALMGRIKHLQRKGWPTGTNPGRGKAAEYGAGPLVRLLVSFELIALHVAPDQIVESLIDLDWSLATDVCLDALADDAASLTKATLVLALDPDGLSSLRGGASEKRAEWLNLPEDEGRLLDLMARGRLITVNVSAAVANAAVAHHAAKRQAAPADQALRHAWEVIKSHPDLSPELRAIFEQAEGTISLACDEGEL